MMTYQDVYTEEFISKLNKLNSGSDGIVPNTEIKDGSIDVENMLSSLGFIVSKASLSNGSGQIHGREIVVDENENNNRQRFTLAHELGHAYRNERIANRYDDSTVYSEEDRQSEIFANAFAAQLLMPKPLVVSNVLEIISEKKLNKKRISTQERDQVITKTAEKMKVSEQAMTYRIENLKVFVPSGE
ncbi:ImmA/IrrE family metallo-endopeptidase [uncultured Secundilactobacillus sp.]|uniref:ImmA/IrrE family metallo-endopeptidase n=1 Tax=uncultured Secundilactobacillus sp. TaxID=2813935 RepID=UPI0025858105|nr:ImmA/IrrE family metallo-endopeptidase [uncultured Secundilactobacillus sp.]